MKVSLFSNFLNNHQLPICNAFLNCIGEDFTFISLVKSGDLIGRSSLDDSYSFVLKAYEGLQYERAMQHAIADDVVIFGEMAGHEEFVKERLKRGKLSFRYNERLLKRGLNWRFFPLKAMRTYKRFIQYRDSLYVLTNSAFTSYDLHLSGFPEARCFKWGYYPFLYPRESIDTGARNRIHLLWAGRMIDWKRPDWAIDSAKRLKDDGFDFNLTICGEGDMRAYLERRISDYGLTDNVQIMGAQTSQGVQRLMDDADIFLLTSTRKEGWGAALNEAMYHQCVCVASSLAGSTPYLINNGVNGYIFDSLRFEDFYSQLQNAIVNREVASSISKQAAATIEESWNPEVAAKRFIELSESLLKGIPCSFEDGPCSTAFIVDDEWWSSERG